VGSFILASLTASLDLGFAGARFANLDFPAVVNPIAHCNATIQVLFSS
jgi:hypothetical protein